MRCLLFAPLVLLGGCQTIVVTPPANCLDFVPPAWSEPVSGADLPAADTLPLWMTFGVQQTGALQKQYERTKDTIHIVGQCEKLANAARPRKKIFGLF